MILYLSSCLKCLKMSLNTKPLTPRKRQLHTWQRSVSNPSKPIAEDPEHRLLKPQSSRTSPPLSLLDRLSDSPKRTSMTLLEHISKSLNSMTGRWNPVNLGRKQLMNMEMDPSELDPSNLSSQPASDRRLTRPTSLGRSLRVCPDPNYAKNCKKHSTSSESTPRTSSSPSLHSSPQPMRLNSPIPIPSGRISSLEPWSTSTMSSQAVLPYPVITETLKSSEQSSSNSVQQKLSSKSRLPETGSSRGVH
jgi:hypothetical protein